MLILAKISSVTWQQQTGLCESLLVLVNFPFSSKHNIALDPYFDLIIETTTTITIAIAIAIRAIRKRLTQYARAVGPCQCWPSKLNMLRRRQLANSGGRHIGQRQTKCAMTMKIARAAILAILPIRQQWQWLKALSMLNQKATLSM